MKYLFRFILASTFLLVLLSFQVVKTQLHITIRNELGNTEEGVTVQLFANEADYKAEQNVVAEGKTDAKGIVKFKELKTIAYYVIARKDDRDNSGGGEQIGKLEANRINKVNVIIQ
ncbi:MAG: hypothetical protein JNM57_00280 [Cyclobacteriaceae bacterium]|nr:hypothetical protein [Cyclobacteriaceae bacterium]